VHRIPGSSPAPTGAKSGRGKGEKGKKSSMSAKAGLQFPVGRMRRSIDSIIEVKN